MKDIYVKTVDCELKAFISIAHKNIIPRGFKYLNEIKSNSGNEKLAKFINIFADILGNCVEAVEKFE